MSKKAWWKSKTIWVNAIAASIAAAPTILPAVERLDNRWYIALAMLIPAVNVLLRAVTDMPIGIKDE